jgi:diacylglycerol kinase family enzyme
MEIDGEVIEDDFLFGAICNSTSIGGILTLPPNQVDMGDGIFEVMLIRAPRHVNEVSSCILAVQNQTYNCGMITFRPAKSVKIITDPFMAWTLDGEKADGYQEITVENLHHAVRIVKRVEEK